LEEDSEPIDPTRTRHGIDVMEHYDGPTTAKLEDFENERNGNRKTPP
jgi:hypothetical protein